MDATEKTACVPRDEKDRNNKSMVLDQHIIELDDLEEPGTSKAAFNGININRNEN